MKKRLEITEKITKILSSLKEKERKVLILRFGLEGEAVKTLDQIGKIYNITRERVRQIEKQGKEKLKRIKDKKMANLHNKIEKILEKSGGLVAEEILIEKTLGNQKNSQNLGSLDLICQTNPKLVKLKRNHQIKTLWANQEFSAKNILKLIQNLEEILEQEKKALSLENLTQKLSRKLEKKFPLSQIKSLILASNKLMMTKGGLVGLTSWPEINPKNTRDKIHYILCQSGRPLHYQEIHQKILDHNFVGKKPSRATVHNELIADDRFVLIGKGIYALRAWGFRPGTVLDILRETLKKTGGLTQDRIIQDILKKRFVSKNTIIMNLVTNPCFVRDKRGLWRFASSKIKSAKK